MSNGTGNLLTLLLVLIAFPIVFTALWLGVIYLMSWIGGWGSLARIYPAEMKPADGQTLSRVTGMFGMARYKNVLTTITTESGIYIETRRVFRPAHKPLFIPFDAIQNARRQTLFFWEYIAFDVGHPPIASLRLPSKVFQDAPVDIVL